MHAQIEEYRVLGQQLRHLLAAEIAGQTPS
jgi:hypothetical protein